jgi:outer membrane biosynthesis protein TonB
MGNAGIVASAKDSENSGLISAIGLLLLALLAGCAKSTHVRHATEARGAVALPACPTAVPPVPDEATRDGRYGVVLVGYTIETDGRVDDIELEDPRASPLLFSAAQRWLEQCRAGASRARPERISELLSFPPPEAPPVQETPIKLEEGLGISRPQRGPNCSPDSPPAAVSGRGTLAVEYVVHTNGRVGEVSLKGGDAPRALFKTVTAWLHSCPYTPATRDGGPVPVTVVESFSFQRE